MNRNDVKLPAAAPRCPWCDGSDLYRGYHDHEWGFPVADRRRLFEKLCLEGFQAGLAWITILRKREAFRAAFANFEPEAVARFGETDVQRLLADAGIVRHRGKIEAAIGNARALIELERTEGPFAAWLWRFAPPRTERPALANETEASRALSKALRQRGFRFVGPTTMHALMQAMGMVNDHEEGCAVRPIASAARDAFSAPR